MIVPDQFFYIAIFVFPPVAALTSFSVDYCSKGKDYDVSIRDARLAFLGAVIVDAIIVVVRFIGGAFDPSS